MTDFEKLTELLTSWGVGFEPQEIKDKMFIVLPEGNAKVDGYSMFYTRFTFSKAGAFKEVGAYE